MGPTKRASKRKASGPLIVHIHLFKNAGTSVDLTLESNFGRKWRNLDSNVPSGRVSGKDVAALLKKTPSLAALSSHQVRPCIEGAITREIRYIGFVRHPLARVRSIYDFDIKRGPETPLGKIANAMDFPSYVERLLIDNNKNICNFQTRSFSSRRDATGRAEQVPLQRHLESACAFSQQDNVVIGLVDDFDRSARDVEALVQAVHPTFSFDIKHANRTSSTSTTLTDRLDSLRVDLGDRIYRQLEERNWADLELLRFLESR